MKILNIAIAALVSLFGITVIWLTTYGPFNRVIELISEDISGRVSGQAQTSIDMLTTYFNTGLTIFIVFTVISIIAWWIMKTQEREVVTEAYYY